MLEKRTAAIDHGAATLDRQSAADRATVVAPSGLPRRIVLLLAAACGLSVANIYYAHPLLDQMARDSRSALLPSAWS
jgi:hypothetical protein